MTAPHTRIPRSGRATETRRRMIEAAFESFSDRGYQGTTMAGVAKRAGVSEQMIYFTFGSKASLLHEVMMAKRGAPDEPTAIMERTWVAEVLSEPNPRRALALTVEHGTEILRRLAPIADAMTAAAMTDPDFAVVLDTIATERRQGMTRVLTVIDSKTPLATSVGRATDVLDVVQSMSTYNAFVRGCRWSTGEYKAWSYQTLTQLLPPVTPGRERALDAAATAGLTFHDQLSPLERTEVQPRASRKAR